MIKWELQAYKGLSFANFSLGLIWKAAFYNDKYLRGKMESDDSAIKKLAVGHVLKQRMNRKEKNKYRLSENLDWDRLIPSPTANNGKPRTSNLLTHLNEQEALKYRVFYKTIAERNELYQVKE
jgi:hypothetical protein